MRLEKCFKPSASGQTDPFQNYHGVLAKQSCEIIETTAPYGLAQTQRLAN